MKIYYHPTSQDEFRRLRRDGFMDGWHMETKQQCYQPLQGVMLDSEDEPPMRRQEYGNLTSGNLWTPYYENCSYDFDGQIEIELNEAAIGQFEIDGKYGRRRWVVPAELLNSLWKVTVQTHG